MFEKIMNVYIVEYLCKFYDGQVFMNEVFGVMKECLWLIEECFEG